MAVRWACACDAYRCAAIVQKALRTLPRHDHAEAEESEEQSAREMFGFLLDALRSGAPPHGGIAIGMDRLAMLLSGAPTLREVIPFPKTNQGIDQMSGAPVAIVPEQLDEVFVRSTAPPPKGP